MPRIKKRGLDYFPINTDFIYDRLVRRLMKREGDAALAVLVEVLSYIYAGEGYYVSADSFFYEDLSTNLYEKSADDVKRIIALAVEYGIFDSVLFNECGILTSTDIQQQFLFSTKRRNTSVMEPRYCLLDTTELSALKTDESQSSIQNRTDRDEKENPEKEAGNNSTEEPETGKVEETDEALKDNAAEKGSMEKDNLAKGACNRYVQEEPGKSDNTENVPEKYTSRGINVTFTPENVTSGTHSIAQNRIAQYSVAENRRNFPPQSPTGEAEEKEEEILLKRPEKKRVAERKEWTDEAITELQAPADGISRNLSGLIENLRQCHVPPSEQYAIICKSNYGVIGHPVWKGFYTLRESHGKIKMPGRYLLSLIYK